MRGEWEGKKQGKEIGVKEKKGKKKWIRQLSPTCAANVLTVTDPISSITIGVPVKKGREVKRWENKKSYIKITVEKKIKNENKYLNAHKMKLGNKENKNRMQCEQRNSLRQVLSLLKSQLLSISNAHTNKTNNRVIE
jgi:hypothetical protein